MKPLFKIREFAWAVVSEVEDWLYPYRTDDTEPLWAEKDVDDDSVGDTKIVNNRLHFRTCLLFVFVSFLER